MGKYIMNKIEKQNLFLSTLIAKYPDVVNSGTVSNAQIQVIAKDLDVTPYQYWLMENRISRGLYALPSNSVIPSAVPSPKKQSVVTFEKISLVPEVDKNFVPFGNYNDLESIIKSGMFYPSYVYGPTGNGKSTMIEQICAKYKKNLIRVNLNMMTDEDQLIGSKTLTDGNVEIVEGPVLVAMRTGTTLLLDEIDAGSANTLLCLQPILEGKPYYFKLKNEMIIPAEGFNIIATANTKGKGSDDGRYIGTNVLNEAFLERFAVTFDQEYPDAKVELKIVKNLMVEFGCVDDNFATLLVKWADAIRKTYDDGGVDELITTRRLVHIVRAFSIFKNKAKAVQLCCNRFDTSTKNAFIDLMDKLAEPETSEIDSLFVNEEVPF
jgi:hypothetical protein